MQIREAVAICCLRFPIFLSLSLSLSLSSISSSLFELDLSLSSSLSFFLSFFSTSIFFYSNLEYGGYFDC